MPAFQRPKYSPALQLVGLFGGVAALAFASTASAQDVNAGSNTVTGCQALAGAVVKAEQIGLPTSGAIVTSAELEAPSGTEPRTTPEYCKVLVEIGPVSKGGEPIRMQLNLPSVWNDKVVHVGGGGLDGVVVSADGPSLLGSHEPSPLSRGYVTFGSDGGHHVASQFNPEQQAAAFLKDEVLVNFAASENVKKAHDAAMVLIQARYGRKPTRSYFIGASYGGREALAAVQKWGADYDGAIAFYPAAGGIPTVEQLGRLSRALAKPGAFPNRAKQV
jgi:hypothetical protein